MSGYGITLRADVKESIKYVLGLLNSRLSDFYLKGISTTMPGAFFRYFTQFIEQLPIRTIDQLVYELYGLTQEEIAVERNG